MQESWEFDLIGKPEWTGQQPLIEEIKRIVEQNENELGIFLSYYYKEEGGLVEEVEFMDNINLLAPTAGTITVKFKVVYFNACWDIHRENKEEMLLNFDVDPLQNKIKLTGPHWPEREPDEI